MLHSLAGREVGAGEEAGGWGDTEKRCVTFLVSKAESGLVRKVSPDPK